MLNKIPVNGSEIESHQKNIFLIKASLHLKSIYRFLRFVQIKHTFFEIVGSSDQIIV